jgi:hypothetical protein
MPRTKALEVLISGAPPKAIRLAAARGALPLAPDEMLSALVHLAGDPDAEVSQQASGTLRSWPEAELCAQLASPECDPAVLRHLVDPSFSESIREAVAANPATPPGAVAALASAAPARIVALILDNRVRLLEFPEILTAVKRNSNAGPEAIRIVIEIEAEFLQSRKSDYRVERGEQESPVPDAAARTEPEPLAPEDLWLEGLPLDPEEREAAMIQRLASMTVQQKIRAALLGNRDVRAVLIRNPNREIASNVLKNPRLTENEVESFAAMRNVSEEILRDIATSREWTRQYNVVQNLARNPKTPPALAQRLLFRLLSKDLSLLARDRGVSELVRRHAERTLSQRNTR